MEESSSTSTSNKGVKVVGFWVSLFSQRVRWGLKLKGIEYEYVEEDINNKSPLLFELNPLYGKVPILVHDGVSFPESRIILEYIDQFWPHNPLMPLDPYHRAQARFWAKFADEKLLDPAWFVLNLEGEDQERAAKIVSVHLEKIEEMIKGKKYFGGNTIGFLDLVLAFIAYILPAWEEVASIKMVDPSKFPGIATWTDNFLNHPVVKTEYFPPKDQTLSYYKCRRHELLPLYKSYGNKIWTYIGTQ
ncbi:hypothetical protein ACS0TY_014488 [Phlomoides rotata]